MRTITVAIIFQLIQISGGKNCQCVFFSECAGRILCYHSGFTYCFISPQYLMLRSIKFVYIIIIPFNNKFTLLKVEKKNKKSIRKLMYEGGLLFIILTLFCMCNFICAILI